MIDKREILDQAAAIGLNPHVVEKDYVLGWLLWGVANHEATADNWIFKGGTCLKKCFFETYRFSEDLDFTLTDPAHLDEDFLRNVFTDISVAVYDRTGIEIPVDRQRVDLLYQGSTRRIEPYSLRRTQEGNVILHAHNRDKNAHRSYRLDRIQGARVTDQSFTPRFAVELSPSGPVSVPPTAPRPPSVRTHRRRSDGPTHVYECAYCGKRFYRKTRTRRLNKHKDKTGYPCPGRSAHYIDTRY